MGLSTATLDSGANINDKFKQGVGQAGSISRPAKSHTLGMRLQRLICSYSHFQASILLQGVLAPALCMCLAGVDGHPNPSATWSSAGVTEGGQAAATLSSPIKKTRHFSCWISAPSPSLRITGQVIAARCAGRA